MSGTAESALFLQNPEAAAIIRRRRLAEELLKGSQEQPIRSHMQGLASVLQRGLASWDLARADQQAREFGERQQAESVAFNQGLLGLGAGQAPAPAPMPAPMAAEPQMTPAAAPSPLPGLPAAPARGDAPPAVAQGIAARAALDPNSPTYAEDIQRINNQVVASPGVLPGMRPQPVSGEAGPARTPLAASLSPGVSAPPQTPLAGRLGVPSPDRLMAAYAVASASTNPLIRAQAPQLLQMAQFGALREERSTDNRRADQQFALQQENAAADRAFRARSLELQAQGLNQQQAHQQATLELQRMNAERSGLPTGYRPGPNGTAERIPGLPPTDGTFQGQGMDPQSANILLRGDPSTPEYAIAYGQLYGPRTQTMADGTVVTIQPQPPPGIRQPTSGAPPQTSITATPPGAQPPPGAAPQAGLVPQGNVMPPGAPGAASTIVTPGATVSRVQGQGSLSEAQSRANLFGNAMSEGERILQSVQVPSSAAIAAWRNLPEGVVNMGLSENDQRYFNAVRQFAAGILRKETGAAFTSQELLDVQSRFFPMPGDSPATIQQKARARQQAIESMRAEVPGGFRGQLPAPGGSGQPPAPPPGFQIVR